jgi:hypothetical protein
VDSIRIQHEGALTLEPSLLWDRPTRRNRPSCVKRLPLHSAPSLDKAARPPVHIIDPESEVVQLLTGLVRLEVGFPASILIQFDREVPEGVVEQHKLSQRSSVSDSLPEPQDVKETD